MTPPRNAFGAPPMALQGPLPAQGGTARGPAEPDPRRSLGLAVPPHRVSRQGRLGTAITYGLGVTTDGDILGLSPNNSADPNDWSHR